MDDSQRQLLEEPFRASLHRARRGAHGRQLTYVETHAYIRRLNEALGGCWSYEIVEYKILDTEAVVLGRLSAGDVIKTAFGSSAISRVRETGETISLGDDHKAAASDALKKASSLLGLGLHLYGDDATAPSERPAEISRMPSAASSELTPTLPTVPTKDQPAGSVLTQRQLRAIQGLSTQAEISEEDLGKWVRTTYGLPVEELDRRQASEVITKINQSLAAGNGNGRAAGGVQ